MKQFGIGRLGSAIVDRARLFAILAVALTAVALASIPGGLVFNGDVTDLLRVDTPGYRDLERMEKDFHPFSTDEVIVVESAGFGDPATFDALAELVAEMQLATGVEAAVSIFSLPTHGSTVPYLASPEASALPPGERLGNLLAGQFLAADLLSKDLTTTLVVLAVAQDGDALKTGLDDEGRKEIEDAAARHAPALSVSFAGMKEIHRTIEEGLRRDQRLLAGSVDAALRPHRAADLPLLARRADLRRAAGHRSDLVLRLRRDRRHRHRPGDGDHPDADHRRRLRRFGAPLLHLSCACGRRAPTSPTRRGGPWPRPARPASSPA
jgi:hypothetical protein